MDGPPSSEPQRGRGGVCSPLSPRPPPPPPYCSQFGLIEFEWRSRFLNSIQGGGKKPWESNAQMVKMAAAYGSLFILPFPVNRLLDREAGFIIILLLLLSPPPVPSNVRPLLVGRIFSVLAGAC